eukprot:Sspe_Gene.110107::Locus_90439_Transcript_1_2_Confidence_0.400_Length_424::g.110107::m.110107
MGKGKGKRDKGNGTGCREGRLPALTLLQYPNVFFGASYRLGYVIQHLCSLPFFMQNQNNRLSPMESKGGGRERGGGGGMAFHARGGFYQQRGRRRTGGGGGGGKEG